jgi:hypothetical protein
MQQKSTVNIIFQRLHTRGENKPCSTLPALWYLHSWKGYYQLQFLIAAELRNLQKRRCKLTKGTAESVATVRLQTWKIKRCGILLPDHISQGTVWWIYYSPIDSQASVRTFWVGLTSYNLERGWYFIRNRSASSRTKKILRIEVPLWQKQTKCFYLLRKYQWSSLVKFRSGFKSSIDTWQHISC